MSSNLLRYRFAGSINGARTVVYSLAFRASTGASRGMFTDGVSLHPVRIKRVRNSSSVRMKSLK